MNTQTSTLQTVSSLHSSVWQTAPRYAEWQLIAVVAGGLAIDARFGWPGQIAVNLWTVAIFIWLMRCGGYVEKCALLSCLAIATVGEVFFSLVWGLYDYQFHNLPLFVPPGHALLMTLGVLFARRAPNSIIWLAPLITLPYVTISWWQGWDTAGVILFMTFIVCMVFGRAKRLYATMFLLSLVMEIYGTRLGNWTWHTVIPGTSFTTPNPPACAGAFYCVLDLLVLGTLSWVTKRQQRASVAALSNAG
ncbi:MAG: hypothetical protein V4568_05355 [Pseudomonadota bacterium]